jgi:hypothetical protein
MKWNKPSKQFQASRRGTSLVHDYYFITTIGAGGKGWLVGYRGFGTQIVMHSAGIFESAQEARAYCEKVDREALVIEEVRA